MTEAFYAIAKASFQGSIVILAVLALRLLLKKAPKSLFCLLWLLAGLRLALPFEIQSPCRLQPRREETSITVQADKPVQVPRLVLQTEDEHLAWSHGEERRRIRNQRRIDKLDGI